MFWRKKSNPITNSEFRRGVNESLKDSEAAALLKDFIEHQSETEQMKDAARSSERPAALLIPQIPIGLGPSVGWFGGNAMLPEGMAWPEQDGQKLLFVGQINLAALPRDLWSGLGPRSGWLGIFLPGNGEFRPTVLHFDGALVEAKAPPPNSAAWTRIYNFDEPKTFVLPRWPLIVETRPGNELHANDASASPQKPSQGSLLDPAFHPFDRETVGLLFSSMTETVSRMARQIVRFPAMKKLRPADAAWFERQKPIVFETFVRFFEIEGRMRAKREFDPAELTGCVEQLAQLDAFEMQYLRNDDEGYCELVLREPKLLNVKSGYSDILQWWTSYEAGLTSHAIKAYTSDPAKLPSALRSRLETVWQHETRGGLGAMGHAPQGHIYTPHGPESPNEVLLEIHTSKLAGWIWGDCYSLVLLIDRSDLRRGDFSNVNFDITN
jgi:Domain of unknown function (DUF1963)